MREPARPPARRGRPFELLRAFLRDPREIATVAPSSRTLTRRLVSCGEASAAETVVELGPGTGVLTRELLEALSPSAKLVAIEINPRLVRILRRDFEDPRLTLRHGRAHGLLEALAAIGRSRADLIVSGIPFSTMAHEEARKTLTAVKAALAPGGRFVAYQFRSHVRRLAEPILGRPEILIEPVNIPPVRIFVWRAGAAPGADALR